jgi:predicted phosphate transport protein (TIGR00153 family)
MATGRALGGLFGRSPIAPLQIHMTLAEESVQLLCQLIQGCIDGDRERVTAIYAQLNGNASQLQAQRRKVIQQLPRGLFLAMPREDLLMLLQQQEGLAHTAQSCARPLALRAMEIPRGLHKPLERLGTLIAGCAAECLQAVRELDELVTQGFGAHERRTIEKMLDNLDRQQLRAAAEYERLFAQISGCEARLEALDAFFFYRLAEGLHRLTEICGELGEQLRLILAK